MHDPDPADHDSGTPRHSDFPPSMGTIKAVLVGVLLILCVGALKLTAAVTMPLAFALFIVVLYEPLLGILKRYMPPWAAALITFQAVLASMVAVTASLWLCATMVSAKAPKYRAGFARAGDTLAEWGTALGLNDELGRGQSGQYLDALSSAAGSIAQSMANAAGGLVLVITLAMLAMSEAGAWRRKLRAQWGDHFVATVSTIATRCRSYVLTRTMTSVLTGVLTGLLAWAVGLDLAFVWAVITTLLNYIPTLGSIVAIIPPTLLAYVQLGGPSAMGVLAGLIVLQVLIGTYLDPKLQGRSLQLSPFVLLFSIGLWGWIWGIAGALLAVPLTMTATVICAQFHHSRWIATLLAEDVEDVTMATQLSPSRQDDREPGKVPRPSEPDHPPSIEGPTSP